eukprot:TRINITY_DN10462_c0_g1_i1.p1 TRINITY_DN10462_c0_g1~~TRINITY_DN10462_c0_g1_i1.p1  ORF type:complete len:272 (+),score=48.24 TRINITY_DN10462_c0_g1_i1:75-818(+)
MDVAMNFMKHLPEQVGEPTALAKYHQRSFLFILVAQAALGVVSLVRLWDLLSFVFMMGQVFVGYYAYKNYMNITYIVIWGLISLANGVLQLVGEVIPILFSIFTLKLSDVLIRVLIPVVSLFGAAFAWHIYVDYANERHIQDFGLHEKIADPLAKMFGHAPPEMAAQQKMNYPTDYSTIGPSKANQQMPQQMPPNQSPFSTKFHDDKQQTHYQQQHYQAYQQQHHQERFQPSDANVQPVLENPFLTS